MFGFLFDVPIHSHSHSTRVLTQTPSAIFGASPCSRQGWPGVGAHQMLIGKRRGTDSRASGKEALCFREWTLLGTSRSGSAGRRERSRGR